MPPLISSSLPKGKQACLLGRWLILCFQQRCECWVRILHLQLDCAQQVSKHRQCRPVQYKPAASLLVVLKEKYNQLHNQQQVSRLSIRSPADWKRLHANTCHSLGSFSSLGALKLASRTAPCSTRSTGCAQTASSAKAGFCKCQLFLLLLSRWQIREVHSTHLLSQELHILVANDSTSPLGAFYKVNAHV